MRTPEQIAHQIASDWIMGRMRMEELERLIALAIRVDRLDTFDVAARVAGDIETGKVTSQKTVAQALLQCAKEYSI